MLPYPDVGVEAAGCEEEFALFGCWCAVVFPIDGADGAFVSIGDGGEETEGGEGPDVNGFVGGGGREDWVGGRMVWGGLPGTCASAGGGGEGGEVRERGRRGGHGRCWWGGGW